MTNRTIFYKQGGFWFMMAMIALTVFAFDNFTNTTNEERLDAISVNLQGRTMSDVVYDEAIDYVESNETRARGILLDNGLQFFWANQDVINQFYDDNGYDQTNVSGVFFGNEDIIFINVEGLYDHFINNGTSQEFEDLSLDLQNVLYHELGHRLVDDLGISYTNNFFGLDNIWYTSPSGNFHGTDLGFHTQQLKQLINVNINGYDNLFNNNGEDLIEEVEPVLRNTLNMNRLFYDTDEFGNSYNQSNIPFYEEHQFAEEYFVRLLALCFRENHNYLQYWNIFEYNEDIGLCIKYDDADNEQNIRSMKAHLNSYSIDFIQRYFEIKEEEAPYIYYS